MKPKTLFVIFALFCLAMPGCGGGSRTSSGPSSLTFDGSSDGSPPSGGAEAVQLVVSPSGVLSGTSTDSSGTVYNITGTISTTGVTSLTLTPNGGGTSYLSTGTFNSGGSNTFSLNSQSIGGFLSYGTSGADVLYELSAPGSRLQYAGNFGGSFFRSSGVSGPANFAISTTGVVTGTEDLGTSDSSPTASITGTVSRTGMLNLTITGPSSTDVETGIMATNLGAGYVITTSNSSGGTTTFEFPPGMF